MAISFQYLPEACFWTNRRMMHPQHAVVIRSIRRWHVGYRNVNDAQILILGPLFILDCVLWGRIFRFNTEWSRPSFAYKVSGVGNKTRWSQERSFFAGVIIIISLRGDSRAEPCVCQFMSGHNRWWPVTHHRRRPPSQWRRRHDSR